MVKPLEEMIPLLFAISGAHLLMLSAIGEKIPDAVQRKVKSVLPRVAELHALLDPYEGHASSSALLDALKDHEPLLCYAAATWTRDLVDTLDDEVTSQAVLRLEDLLGLHSSAEWEYVSKAAARTLGALEDPHALEPLQRAHKNEQAREGPSGVREAMHEAIMQLLPLRRLSNEERRHRRRQMQEERRQKEEQSRRQAEEQRRQRLAALAHSVREAHDRVGAYRPFLQEATAAAILQKWTDLLERGSWDESYCAQFPQDLETVDRELDRLRSMRQHRPELHLCHGEERTILVQPGLFRVAKVQICRRTTQISFLVPYNGLGARCPDRYLLSTHSDVVHDTKLGLTWSMQATPRPLRWRQAVAYAELLSVGLRRWRLPTSDELAGLAVGAPPLAPELFPGADKTLRWWTSSSSAQGRIAVDLQGREHAFPAHIGVEFPVRCVCAERVLTAAESPPDEAPSPPLVVSVDSPRVVRNILKACAGAFALGVSVLLLLLLLLRSTPPSPAVTADAARPSIASRSIQAARQDIEYTAEVSSTPTGAAVLLDGVVLGKTPIVLKQLNTHLVHQVAVRKRGFVTQVRSVSNTDSFTDRGGESVLSLDFRLVPQAHVKTPPRHRTRHR